MANAADGEGGYDEADFGAPPDDYEAEMELLREARHDDDDDDYDDGVVRTRLKAAAAAAPREADLKTPPCVPPRHAATRPLRALLTSALLLA